jgi:release factor glutamine methyltransferase
MTIKELLRSTKLELKKVPVPEPDSSAEFLLRHVLAMDRSKFYANLEKKLTDTEIEKYKELINRRKKHEPVWQIVGKVEFYGLDFTITSDVLIPRPETEFLVERAIKDREVSGAKEIKILDVGTGAGPIVIALAKNIQGASFYASDVSDEALKIAGINAKDNKVEKLIQFKTGNLLDPWKGEKFDIITANLPYIPHEDLPGLTVEIHHYEPRVALDGGNGGLVLYEEFIKEISVFLNPRARVYCEIGKNQGKLFTNIVQRYLPNTKCTIIPDLAGFDRIAVVELTDLKP